MALYVTDAGGTRRQITAGFVTDATGTRRQLIAAHVTDATGTRRTHFFDLIQISDELIFASGVGGASAEYELSHLGDIIRIVNGMPEDIGDWITPKVRMSDYECRATLVSGSLSSGTTNTWLSLSQLRRWTLFRFVSGPQTTVLQIQIRRAADQVVLDSAQITLQVLVEE